MRTTTVRRWLALHALSACQLHTAPAPGAELADAPQAGEVPTSVEVVVPPMAACPNGDGTYCGRHGLEADEHVMYRCAAGELSIASVCAIGCESVGDGGHDRCLQPAAVSSAAQPLPQSGAGGPSARAGAGGMQPTAAGAGAGPRAGAGGERAVPHAGTGGRAGAPATQLACPHADGSYCGGHGLPGDPDVLYRCTDGRISILASCPLGCLTLGGGAQDACRAPAPPPPGPGTGMPFPPPGPVPGEPAPPP